ncbi:TetR/AcrR family transcriptional regulator [Robertkochia solimangrovi]|uniref:TetR/AcrR family transcriptional regulator n=1 Tax=Robertkochia solimangrovi TaxID=2213046 RepID=UPI00117FEF93|nr:TetR/AcrR family transcriptional regulator [Robertkochia solimangrovi]TRZ45173.1 TetR/AcrR family transcriptional regulator [Robertkochia solimangrovi]
MTTTKAERTSQFIIKTIAPIFNKKGYAATSLSDITNATGLTKGAIYGNFENKEELAEEAFTYLFDLVISNLEYRTSQGNTPFEKLICFTDFYKEYYQFSNIMGGCPLINFGVDCKNQNPQLLRRVQDGITRIEGIIEDLIDQGKNIGEIRKNINGKIYGKRFYSLIQGAILMTQTTENPSYLADSMHVIVDTMNQRFR